MKKLLMISGDRSLAEGKQGAFYNTLEESHKYWDRIDIICPGVKNQQIKEIFGNVFIHSSPWSLLFQVKFIFRKGKEIFKHNKFDLITVHEYAPFYNGLGGYLLSRATRVPYVLEIMHIPGLPRSASLKEFVYKCFTKFFIRFDAHKARAVRVINQKQTKDFLIQAGVPISRIKYIPAFYINLDIFKPVKLEKKYDIIYVARLEPNKGIFNLLKAIKILRGDRSNLKVCVIGDGPLRDDLKKYIHSNRLEEVVEMSGWLRGPEDVAHFLNQSRVFVNPSLNEGGPRVALEAMACGVPVVTTPVGVMVDIIKDGENGLLCDWKPQSMADKIARMLDDSGLQEKCLKAGTLLVQQFERKQTIANYSESLMSISKKRLLVITQKVDEHDQLLGFFIEWLRRLGQETNCRVLCLEKGSYDLPGIFVESLGKEKGNSKLSQLWNFYSYIIRHSNDYDAVFVHMNPIWAVLGGWYWRLTNKKIVLWYTSKGVTLKLRIATWFADIILTASRESFRLDSSKVIITGHGIDTDVFRPAEDKGIYQKNRILTVGRIAPVKNYEVLVDAVKLLGDATDFHVTIVGEAALARDKDYESNLKKYIIAEGLNSRITFVGKIEHTRLPALYNDHNLFVHMSNTGSLDKALLEAMACGLTVVSSNDAARAFLPEDYCFKGDSPDSLKQAITYAIKHPKDFRDYVVQNNNLGVLIKKIVKITNEKNI